MKLARICVTQVCVIKHAILRTSFPLICVYFVAQFLLVVRVNYKLSVDLLHLAYVDGAITTRENEIDREILLYAQA